MNKKEEIKKRIEEVKKKIDKKIKEREDPNFKTRCLVVDK